MKTQKLNNKQRKVLKKMMNWRLAFCALALCCVVFVTYLTSEYSNSLNNIGMITTIIISIISITGFYFLFTRKIKNDLYTDLVELREWTIDSKVSHETDDPGIGKDGWTTAYTKYQFNSGGYSFRVNKDLYEKLNIGGVFIVPTTPYSEFEFDPIEKLD